jgi:hypothetical protein
MLLDHVYEDVLNKKGKDKPKSLEAMVIVVKRAASIYGNDWNGFLDATAFVFTGYYGHGAETMWAAHHGGVPGMINDGSGFHPDFKDVDGSQQVRHFWAGFATAANPTGSNVLGELMAYSGNDYHEITQDTREGSDGSTVADYALTVTAIDIANQVGDEIKTPKDLVGILINRLGPNGSGYVGPSIPREWWWTPDD